MKKAFVAIGVNKTGGLPVLRGAVDGAERMATWAHEQGFETSLLTDKSGPVRLAEISKSVRDIAELNIYSQLIVYFSGHGFLKGSSYEIWLLSGCDKDANEAVNVLGSIDLARYCGISHLVFISDACRSVASTLRTNNIMGGLIFPNDTPKLTSPEVDIFYATIPGDPALEIPPDVAAKNYRGIFTECFLNAMNSNDASLIFQIQEGRRKKLVIPSRPLKDYLLKAVPDAASRASIKLSQRPEIRIESALPLYLGKVNSLIYSVPVVGAGDADIQSYPSAGGSSGDHNSIFLTGSLSKETGKFSMDPFDSAVSTDLKSAVDGLYGLRGRLTFETRTGFTIHGVKVRTAKTSQGTCDVFTENDISQVRVHADSQAGATIIQFHTGNGVCLASLPGYVATIVVGDDGQVLSVNYTPARGTDLFNEYLQVADDLELRRATAAVYARNAEFVIDRRVADSFAQKIRMLKAIDPTLGIYAAYAYSQIGRQKDIVSIGEFMADDNRRGLVWTIPFDVAMLNRSTTWNITSLLHFPPYMPMLTQGWALLGPAQPFLPGVALRAMGHLIPSLWTSFSQPGMEMLFGAIDNGEFP